MSITKYFRNVLAAQMSPRINFKNDSFVKVKPEQIKMDSLLLIKSFAVQCDECSCFTV